jgi:hypothetical protein
MSPNGPVRQPQCVRSMVVDGCRLKELQLSLLILIEFPKQ